MNEKPATAAACGRNSQQVGPCEYGVSRAGVAGPQCEHFGAGAGATRQAGPPEEVGDARHIVFC